MRDKNTGLKDVCSVVSLVLMHGFTLSASCEHTGRNGQIHVTFSARAHKNVKFSVHK